MSFYVTLPSDSSMRYFSNNKISHFVTRLPQPVDLKGEWEVGLSEFIYPHMWNNVYEGTNEFLYDVVGDGFKQAFVPAGYYESPADIIKYMNMYNFEGKINLIYNRPSKRVKISLVKGARLHLKSGLAEKLGFFPGEVCEKNSIKKTTSFTCHSDFTVDHNSDFKLLYVYSDFVETQMIGDTFAPLLRVITVRGEDGDMIHEIFDRPHYLPLNKKFFETIEIVIRTHTGDLVPFEGERSIVKLHFRQKFLS